MKLRKYFKKGMAVCMASLLFISSQPSYAAYALTLAGQAEANDGMNPAVKKSSGATASNAEKVSDDEVSFNTGNYEVCVVDRERFDAGAGDAFFEEDGSYTINIPESNPFFPYEVQFKEKGRTKREWFMDPDDSVKVGGHTFYISAYFDGTAVTQMSLNVAGDTVVVYPEKKKFTDGAAAASLLPLEERHLTVDLTDYTPVDLTMVKLGSIFTGENEGMPENKIIWQSSEGDQYTISSQEDTIDFGHQGFNKWEMIVGEDNQLASGNIRYFIDVKTADATHWLIPTVYKQDKEGNRTKLTVSSSKFDRYDYTGSLEIIVKGKYDLENGERVYISLEVNPDIFGNPDYNSLKANGSFWNVEEVRGDITSRLFAGNMEQKDAGVPIELTGYEDFYGWGGPILERQDSLGKTLAFLQISIDLRVIPENWTAGIKIHNLYRMEGNLTHDVEDTTSSIRWKYQTENGCQFINALLKEGLPVNGKYFFRLSYYNDTIDSKPIESAYIGQYSSMEEALNAGAADIKEELFGRGYEADYSKGIYFTIFTADGKVWKYCVRTVDKKPDGNRPGNPEAVLGSSTDVTFTGLKDPDGNAVPCYVVDGTEDSYGDYTYRTILVGKDVDLKRLAPEFEIDADGIRLYTGGSAQPEISGENIHDFSGGPVQYTASSENKKAQKNYWLQVIRPEDGRGRLYINSLADRNAKTTSENGAIKSVREMFITPHYEYRHDILLINTGTEEIADLNVEIDSDDVELDEYWTLKGGYPLGGFITADGDMSNMAKLRILPKNGTNEKKDISGTLTIKSGNQPLMVLTLTGTIGDLSFITSDLPEAVKYVPYGTMIQNDNKYEENRITYELADGTLPNGMELKPNGELYGVPLESGEFTFTARMNSSDGSFEAKERTFTLTVTENTNENVEASTDKGYELTERVPNITLDSTEDHTMVSNGAYVEFVALYLDGVKLKRNEEYIAESGSTRLTIRSQTLKGSNTPGTHTLAAEFRSGDSGDLKRAAQNYEVTEQGSNGNHGTGNGSGNSGNNGNGNGNNSSGGGSDSGNDNDSGRENTNKANVSGQITDPKKGYVDAVRGIITGEDTGYSRWFYDGYGWKLIYADGTMAAGTMIQLEDGESAEQVLWELVNGSWYAFGANEYLKSGWVFDYQLNNWYLTSDENGMQSGWYTDSQDGQTYYMDPVTGRLAVSWMLINNNWYYFQALAQEPTWEFDKETGKWLYDPESRTRPYGALYRDEMTPDGYYVNEEGIWEEEK